MSLLNFQLPAPTPTLFASFLTLDQAILDALPIGVYACNVEGQIVRVNHRAVQLWGRAPKLLDAAQKFCGSFRVKVIGGDELSSAAVEFAATGFPGTSDPPVAGGPGKLNTEREAPHV